LRQDYAFQNNILFDGRTKLQVILDAKKNNIDLYPNFRPQGYPGFVSLNNEITKSFYPLSSISNSFTINGNENGQWSIIETDRFGFNNPDKVWDDLNIEVAMIGDSFLYGHGLNKGEDIASYFRENFKKKTINISATGNGPLIEYCSFREYLKDLKPKIVFWFYTEMNDLSDLEIELENNLLNNYLKNNQFSQKLTLNQNKTDKILKQIAQKEINSEKKGWIKLRNIRHILNNSFLNFNFNKLSKKTNKETGFINNKFFEIISKINNEVSDYGGKFYFVYLPTFERYTQTEVDDGLFLNKNTIISKLKKSGINIIDIHDELFSFSKNPKEFFVFEMNSHFNSRTNSEIALHIGKISNL
jgi:hypothetical protein